VRLAPKMFLGTAMVVAVPVGAAVWSLVAMSRLVATNRELVTRIVPALRLEESVRESLPTLVRLESRYAVLRDAAYQTLWSARADRMYADLVALHPLLATDDERRRHRKALAAFASYRRIATAARDQVARGRRPVRIDTAESRRAAKHAEHGVATLVEATHEALERTELRVQRLHRRTLTTVMNAVAASLVVALVGAIYLTLRLTRSLRRLSAATAEIAQGSYTGPVRVESQDEVGELARSFDRMATRLSELDRAKEEFFSNISHELRTPLTAMREGIALLRDRIAGPLAPRQARLVEIMDRSTERVLRLVDRILELSRLRAGLLAIERRPVDVDALARRAVDELRPQAEARALVADARPAGEPVVVLGDEARLHEVVVNLVGNAIKFTPAGGAVRVRVGAQDGHAELVVEDTGPGIPAIALPRVFERYWQAPGARSGSGLGLAIVKGVVEAHGGRVDVTSEEGKGSRFTVTLPRVERTG